MQLAPARDGASGHGRIALLDGLRGLCALLIVFFHFHLLGEDRHTHAYLAVDVFFLLSGFVVAGAYEARLKSGGGISWFFGVRMARLYPLYVFGLVLGALVALAFHPAPAVGLAFARGLAFLPQRLPGSPAFYALNPVFWSLGAELLINLIYGAGGFRLPSWALAAVCAPCALGLFVVGAVHGDCNPGANATALDLTSAGLRVGFAFPFGVLAYRWAGLIKAHVTPLSPAVLIAAVVVLLTSPLRAWAYDPLVMTLALPLLFVAFVAAPAVQGRAERACDILGRLSYPLYVCHYPLIDAYFQHEAGQAALYLGAAAHPLSLAAIGLVVLALAWFAHKAVEPGGKRLITRLLVKPGRPAKAQLAAAGS
jgi:peptidoglycan/LPS O-acetylase OafA/YrhL